MDKFTKDFYNNNALNLIDKYNSVKPAYHSIIKKLFKNDSKVLDIGCGSGRDVRILLELGIDAYGLEPSSELISNSPLSLNITERILSGSLPDNIPTQIGNTKWDGILLIAVLQHLTDNDLKHAVKVLHDLLDYSGTLIISIPLNYPDIKNDRDKDQRLFIIRSVKYYLAMFNKSGFKTKSHIQNHDALNRDSVSWTTLILKKI